MDQPVPASQQRESLIDMNDPDQQNDQEPQSNETNEFKPKVFAEFFCYFLLAQWFGPLAYFFFLRWIKNGHVLARNLHIYGGWEEIIRTLLWIARWYCFVTTFTAFSNILAEGLGEGQFWLVIYTDISIAVLYGAYYSSFTDSEIQRFKTEVYDPEHDITTRITNLIYRERTKALDKKVILGRFPEIDINNFYFVYPESYQNMIPATLQPEPLSKKAAQLSKIQVKNGLIVDAVKYAMYLADKSGYSAIKYKVLTIQVVSRIIVVLRVLLPVAANVLNIAENNTKITIPELILLIVQQVFYCYFIYRVAMVYDILFLGLLLYYKKLRQLRLLKKLIDIRPQGSQHELLRIVPAVPHNVENWLNIRKIFAGMNQQAFVVIDVNMSFALFYTIIFIAIYALYSVSLLQSLLKSLAAFLKANPMLQVALFVTLTIIIIVLVIHLVLGIYINMLFKYERREWTLQSEVVRSIRISHDIYREWRGAGGNQPIIDNDEYLERVNNIKSLMGADYKENFEMYVKRLRDSIFLVLDGLNYEETFNPHTLLGIMTTPRLAVSIFTAISAVGLSTINNIFNSLKT